MFLFATKTKTPISTYTDSYRPPNTMKKAFEEAPMTLWSENKFVTQPHSSWSAIKSSKSTLSSGFDRLPKSCNINMPGLRFQPSRYFDGLFLLLEREVVVNMLNSLSRKQLPYVRHQYPIPGRMPYQGYYSPCTDRHYCLRGMDYYVDGAPSTERQISQLVEKIVRSFPYYDHQVDMMLCARLPSLPPSFPYMNLKWDTSHFKRSGGLERDSYIIHPEFVSEAYPTPPCWY
ncbi:spermatid-specific manchette-related protein 1 [Notechis scutatus]|uniref:Spermatid-specific manchette-related protein 1 n=1 Tax=Notechis scutatus TaxID=8663 RepID=A0A6J1VJI2_9SAUR|nr:spermatid-specific manchette-related protein 1 [Notechis scutatus]